MSFLQDILKECKVSVVAAEATSAGTAVTSSAVDMMGFDAVAFMTSITTANAGNFLKAQQSSDDGGSDDYTDIAGSKVVADSNADECTLSIMKPLKRYLKAVIIRAGANTATTPIWCIQYNARTFPQVNTVANVRRAVSLISPAEGTP